ncbi:hypothetical protein Tco_0752313 [Tanacetum coccineum]|uniref:Integrase, catalytic region, zinc finger, CCHC-type, peptidase aspartic, catalytic n=1 Tax=Tanacetum coccineum TaxID=301880 RepID=A0ABQ4Z7D7_9ASTR
MYDSIKIMRARHNEKTIYHVNDIEVLKAQLRSKEPVSLIDLMSNQKFLAPAYPAGLESYGKTICRYWLSMETPGKNLTLIENFIVVLNETYRKKFALGEICQLTKLSVKCRTGHALVSRLRLFKTYDGESFKAHEFCGKVHRGLGHNLFSVGQFCDSDLEVAFRKHTCFVRDIKGTNILKGSRGTNLYTIIDEKR